MSSGKFQKIFFSSLRPPRYMSLVSVTLLFTVVFVGQCLFTVVCCLLLCLLFTVVCWLLLCLLVTVCCLLFVGYCLLSLVSTMLHNCIHLSCEQTNQGMLFSLANRLEQKGENGESQQQSTTPSTRPRPLYDVPYMFDAREFLRKRLIGKKVKVTVDYIKPAQNNFPERMCCTVTREDV